MSPTPQLFSIDPQTRESQQTQEVDFSELGFYERYDIQEWIAANPSILGEELLIVTKEFSEFDKTNERLDLLALDWNGKLIIIELKRDDTGADVHWQAIKYASYLDRATPDEIVRMLADHEELSEEEARTRIMEHIGANDIDSINNDQSIILASHRFAPEVTSAVLWLNEKTGGNLITCVQLTPYKDATTGALYLLANTIIPVPGAEAYRIQTGSSGTYGLVPQGRANPHSQEIKRVFEEIEDALDDLDDISESLPPDEIFRPTQWGYRQFWYSREPWEKWDLAYMIQLQNTNTVKYSRSFAMLISGESMDNSDGDDWVAEVNLIFRNPDTLAENVRVLLDNLNIDEEQERVSASDRDGEWHKIAVRLSTSQLDSEFIGEFTDKLRHFIETATPQIDEAYQQSQLETGDEATEESEEDD